MRTPLLVPSLLLALLAGARSADAQPPGLTLLLTTSHTRIAPGGTLRLTIGAFNQGAPVPMDVYCVVLLPDGDTLVALRGAGTVSGRLSQLAAIPPLAANVTLPAGFTTTVENFLTYTFSGAEPGGTYRFVLAAVRPGSLADGRVDGGDLIALASRDLTLGPPLTTEVDPGHAASGLVTPLDGGTVTTTAADGTIYTLTIPAGAVAAETTITLTPVIGLSGLSQPPTRLAAVRAEPSGLQFARPARLTVEVPTGVPSTALAALYISDGGTRGELTPVAAGGRRLAVQVTHFSDVVIPVDTADLIAQFGQSGFYATAVLYHTLAANPNPGPQPLRDHLVTWYDTHVRVLLQTGQSEDHALRAGLAEFIQWEHWRLALERDFGDVVVGNGAVRGQLTSRGTEGRTLAVTGLAALFAQANDRCLAGTGVNARLADAEAAARSALLARDYFDELAHNQSQSPAAVQIASPDLTAHGLDAASAAARLCAQMKIDHVLVPNLGPSQTGTLTVVAGLSFAGEPTVFSRSAGVSFCSDPTGASGGCTLSIPTNAAGQVTFPVTATAGGVVRYIVCAQPSYPQTSTVVGLYLTFAISGRRPCRSSTGGVVVTPAETTIAPGASRQFTAVVEDTVIQDVTWRLPFGGGTITPTGLFTSNGTPGTFYVVATSVADPTQDGTGQVTVTGPGGGGGEEGPCPGGCTFPGTFTFCNRGTCNAPTLGTVTAHTFRPLPTTGRSGALSWVCGGALVSAELTRSGGNFTGLVTRTGGGACRELGTTVNVPITGSVSASALAFVVQVAGSPTTTLTFETTAAAASASEER